MDKSAIKSFAIEARKILMKSAITQAGFYGISKDGCAQPTQKGAGFEVYRTIAGTDNRVFGDDIKRREKLVRAVEEKGFDQVIEETAYTWFNRLIAIRFMEVNGYLPTRTRVLSSETGSNTPDLMSQYMDVDLDMTMDELEKVQTCVRENRYDDAFALLFVKQCNALNEILPELFEKTTDYMELLLKLSYTSDGVVRMLVDTIPESNFDIEQEGQIEIIGWMYQYYNTELKDDTFALLKKNVKITKERIPSATQLFTPDWIVRYMVENSLGRLWIEGHPDEDLKANWKYYLEEAEQEADVQAQLEEIRKEYKNLNPEDIKVIDPCMGSGHILVYCFDILMQIYESQGYTQRDAARLILENNLYGLDIDKRAAQLAYFAVMMKARQYDRRIFSRSVTPNVLVIEESNGINRNQLNYFGAGLSLIEKNNAISQMTGLLDSLKDAKEYGSILEVENYDWKLLETFCETVDFPEQMTFDTIGLDELQEHLLCLVKIGKCLSQKYHVAVTNPPYMGGSNMSPVLQKYVKDNYDSEKGDLYAVFIKRLFGLLIPTGFEAMVTMHTWMFISSFEKFRKQLLKKNIINIAHHGAKAFENDVGTIVQTVSFVMRNNTVPTYIGRYEKLTEYGNSESKETALKEGKCPSFYQTNEVFNSIPGCNLAYWLDSLLLKAFDNNRIEEVALSDGQTKTGNNDKYLRRLWEIKPEDIGKDKKWAFIAKGGSFRKWYGNIDTVIDWSESARKHYKSDHVARIAPEYIWFRHGFVFNHIAESSKFAVREIDTQTLFETAAPAIFVDDDDKLYYIMGYLNTWIAREIIIAFNPTFNTNVRDITTQPIIWSSSEETQIVNSYVKECIRVCKEEWDSFETSIDFQYNPLLEGDRNILLADKYFEWEKLCDNRNAVLKQNEILINEYFTNLYQLQGSQMDTEINIAELYHANMTADIRNLLSYAVGCMFGRYSLEEPGIVFAGGEWKPEKYHVYKADTDNCIPITDEEYFEDDIVGLFCEWIKTVFGSRNLEANLDFVAKALGNRGTTSREVIRNYFLNDFMKDHMKTYQKRPIYWMFDSGKQNGFKCLTYMHRYDRDTVGRVRSDYLRKSQEAIEAALKNAEYTIQNSTSAIDKATATKKRDKYIKQLSEIRTYFQALSHVALQRIDIDLDDGVKVNYEKFQNIEIVDENGKKQKINLLTKI